MSDPMTVTTRATRTPHAPAARFAGLCILLGLLASPAEAQLNTPIPEQQETEIEPQLNAQVPLDLRFRNEQGESVELSELIDGTKPVALALVYYTCPQLCNLVLTGMCDGFDALADWDGNNALQVGEDFEVITVSFYHEEGPELAAAKKRNHLATYDRPEWEEGWHWLSSQGHAEDVRRLAETIGFHFKVDPSVDPEETHFAHHSALFLLTPEGRLSGVIPQHEYPREVLRFGLMEASQGKIEGTLMDRAFLFCFQYDPDANSYVANARAIMSLAGALMVLLLGGFLGVMWWRESRRSRHDGEPGPQEPSFAESATEDSNDSTQLKE